jgi:hypothetical protein
MTNRPLQSSQKSDKQSYCLEKCLQGLSLQDRQLVEGYYKGEGSSRLENRKKLAASMDIRIEVLRIMAHSIRMKLKECMQECLAQSVAEVKED